jgi:hypothetical protein
MKLSLNVLGPAMGIVSAMTATACSAGTEPADDAESGATTAAITSARPQTFACTFQKSKDSTDDDAFYGKKILFKVFASEVTVLDGKTKKDLDDASISDKASSFSSPRYFGLASYTDCAQFGYVEVPKSMLQGKAGTIHFDGEMNEDCGITPMDYRCEPQ